MIKRIIEAIQEWLHPNLYPKSHEHKKKVDHSKSSTKIKIAFEKSHNDFDEEEALEIIDEKEFDEALYYHDANVHKVVCKFDVDACYRYQKRNDRDRRKLKPLLFPIQTEAFDRTHVIPIGYHGSENDNRIVVGWDSKQNQQDMRDFESEIAEYNRSRPIIWLTFIEKLTYGAKWTTKIYTITGHLLKEKEFIIDDRKFVWKP